MVDVVNFIEKRPNTPSEDLPGQSTSKKPAFRNPNDIPDYDSIETIEVAQVYADQQDDSIVSTDEFVPDLDESVQINTSLNLNLPTNHL